MLNTDLKLMRLDNPAMEQKLVDWLMTKLADIGRIATAGSPGYRSTRLSSGMVIRPPLTFPCAVKVLVHPGLLAELVPIRLEDAEVRLI